MNLIPGFIEKYKTNMSDELNCDACERVSTLSISLIKSFNDKEGSLSECSPASNSASMNKITPNVSVSRGTYFDVPLSSTPQSTLRKVTDINLRKSESDKCFCRIF